MVSLGTVRNTVLFGGAIAAGIAAFTIAYGRDRGTPMRLPVMPKLAPAPPGEAHVTPRRLEPPPIATPPVTPAFEPSPTPTPPDPEVAKQIGALTEAARKHLAKTPPAGAAPCAVVAPVERKRINRLVVAWIKSQHPDEGNAETDQDGMDQVVGVGCGEPEGVLVSAALDRADKKTKRPTVRRNYVLRVSGDHIDVIAERTSTPSIDWMEWADEGGLSAVGTLDMDGDGKRDTIYLDTEHEGGAMHEHYSVMLRTADGAVSHLATITDMPDIQIVNGKLVVASVHDSIHQTYFRCLDKDRQLSACPEAVELQRGYAKYDALARLEDQTFWNREELAADFATLGIKGHADLVAAMPERPADDKLRDDVQRFLVATNQYDPADALVERSHVEATQFFAQLASQLGDRACPVPALTDDVKKTVTEWVERQAHQDMPVTIQPDCGNYVWTSYFKKEGQIEGLLTVDNGTVTKVLSFPGAVFEGPGTGGLIHQGGFFLHGSTLVGLVFEDTAIHAIVNGKVIAKRVGQPRLIDYDTRWMLADHSFNLVSDGTAVIHATATGLETIDPEPLRPHQIHRAALDRVLDGYKPMDATFLAALRTLGAPASLVAEAKAQLPKSAP